MSDSYFGLAIHYLTRQDPPKKTNNTQPDPATARQLELHCSQHCERMQLLSKPKQNGSPPNSNAATRQPAVPSPPPAWLGQACCATADDNARAMHCSHWSQAHSTSCRAITATKHAAHSRRTLSPPAAHCTPTTTRHTHTRPRTQHLRQMLSLRSTQATRPCTPHRLPPASRRRPLGGPHPQAVWRPDAGFSPNRHFVGFR